MINYLKQLFIKKRLKKYSTTMTSANEGSDSKKEFNPDVKRIIGKIQSNDRITHEELNSILSFYFDKKEINPGVYVFNKDIVNGMVFEIVKVNAILNENDDVENIFITLKDMVYNIEFFSAISGREFYEIFKDFKPQFPLDERSAAHVD